MGSRNLLAMCKYIYSTGRERTKLLLSCSHPRPGSSPGKISRIACSGETASQSRVCCLLCGQRGFAKILTINQEPNLSGIHQDFFPARSRHLRKSLGEMLSGPLKKDQRALNLHEAALAGKGFPAFLADTQRWEAVSPDAEWSIPLFRADFPTFSSNSVRIPPKIGF